jgi:hypothetical protein
LTADLRSVPSSEFKRKVSPNGKEYVEVWYNLALTANSASMVFSLEFGGKEQGRVEARYD